MQETILNHIKEKYNPDAVILHGSRARNMAREHSDWDFIFIYREKVNHSSGRELFEEQNIEFSVVILPVQDILETFSNKLQKAIVLFERKNEGTTILTDAEKIYSESVHWSNEKIADHRLWFQGRIEGMRDNVNRPEIFYKYFSDVYSRIFNYWYFLKQHTYSEPIYIAVQEIEKKDPSYLSLVSQFANFKNLPEEKVVVVEEIRDFLFPLVTERDL